MVIGADISCMNDEWVGINGLGSTFEFLTYLLLDPQIELESDSIHNYCDPNVTCYSRVQVRMQNAKQVRFGAESRWIRDEFRPWPIFTE